MLRWAVVAVVSGRVTTNLGSVCTQLLAPPSAPEHPLPNAGHEHDHEAEVEESTLEARCLAAGVSAPDCAFFHEVLSLAHAAKGFEEPAFCASVQAAADCNGLLRHVLTGPTVQDLVEAECLKRGDDAAYCTELKLSVGSSDRAEDAKGLWQCYKAHEAARAEKAHRAHAEAHAEVEEVAAPEPEEPEPPTEHGTMLAAAGAVLLLGAAAAGYVHTRPRVVLLDDSLIANEGYSQVLDAYNRGYE